LKSLINELQNQLEEKKRDELKQQFLLHQMQLVDGKKDVIRLASRTSEVLALKMARRERDTATKRTYEEKARDLKPI